MNENQTTESNEPVCIYNPAIICSPRCRNCESCGWNPQVAKARLKKIGYRPDAQENAKNY